MKIAFDAKRFFNNASGLGNYSRDLVRILATHYPENEYLLINKSQSERGSEIVELDNVIFRPTSNGSFARQFLMGKDAQDAGADLFHGLSGELPLKWHDKSSIKKIVTIHDLIFLRHPEYYSFFDRKIYFWKFKKAAEQADLIIAISEQTKQDIIDFLNVSENKIRVVYQGCHQAFKEADLRIQQTDVAAKYALPDRFLLSVGTIETRKNLLNTLKAIQGTDIPMVVVGKKKKEYWKKLQKFIRKNALEKQVVVLENVGMEDLAALYRLADVMIYPSLYEGFGIPVIEALFSGTPVITSNLSSLPEAGGPAALYVKPDSPDDIRSKINFLWNNAAERARRAEMGLQYARKFSDAAIAYNLMKVYTECLNG